MTRRTDPTVISSAHLGRARRTLVKARNKQTDTRRAAIIDDAAAAVERAEAAVLAINLYDEKEARR